MVDKSEVNLRRSAKIAVCEAAISLERRNKKGLSRKFREITPIVRKTVENRNTAWNRVRPYIRMQEKIIRLVRASKNEKRILLAN